MVLTEAVRRKSFVLILLFVLGAPAIAFCQDTVAPVLYDLNVKIEPEHGSIAVQGEFDIPIKDSNAKELVFDLHETFTISELRVDGKKADFSFRTKEFSFLNPATRTVVVSLPADPSRKTAHVKISYAGPLKVLPEFGAEPNQKLALDDQINSRMVELASYSSWYPQFPFGQPLQSKLTVSLPQGWTTVCSGKKLDERVQKGRTVTRWSSGNDTDILVLASKNYRIKSATQAGTLIEIYHTQMPEAFIDREFKQISGVLELYSQQLGRTSIPGDTVKHVFSPKRKGQGLAGISRPGMIATSEGRTLDSLAGDPNFSLFQGIAHEIAHFWWNFGAGQGDWVNEAFAEYFSVVAVQKISSDEDFRKVLASYRRNVGELPTDAPSLSKVPFAGGQVNWVVRYKKGALMLNLLRETMGDDKFFAAARSFFQTYKGQRIGTAEFRNFWKNELGEKADLIDACLDTPGRAVCGSE